MFKIEQNVENNWIELQVYLQDNLLDLGKILYRMEREFQRSSPLLKDKVEILYVLQTLRRRIFKQWMEAIRWRSDVTLEEIDSISEQLDLFTELLYWG